jgi:hypothetical protein
MSENVTALRSPAEMWDRALRHIDAADRHLAHAASMTRDAAVRAVAHRERAQLQMLRDRVRPELLTLQIESNRKAPRAANAGAMTEA